MHTPTDTRHLPGDRRASPPLPAILARLAEPIYRAELARRNNRYNRGRGVNHAPIPVVSVGNLSVGGTGKTPFTAWLSAALRERGHAPGIALRGYKAKPGQPADETREHEQRLPRTPVRADPERLHAVRRLARDDSATVAVLDDGFQHRRLHRDLDIVLVDATRDPFTDRCLPAGWLREPVASLARADAVVITRAELADAKTLDRLAQRITNQAPKSAVAFAEHRWTALIDSSEAAHPTTILDHKPVTLASGIGHPAAFRAAAEAHGARVHHHQIEHDHHDWSRQDATGLLANTPANTHLLTTQKDWVKLATLLPEELRTRALRPRLELTVTRGERDLLELLDTLPPPPRPTAPEPNEDEPQRS